MRAGNTSLVGNGSFRNGEDRNHCLGKECYKKVFFEVLDTSLWEWYIPSFSSTVADIEKKELFKG